MLDAGSGVRFLRQGSFLGSREDYAGARVCLLGLPLDVSTSFRPGCRFGPAVIRAVSEVLEEFSPAVWRSLGEVPFCDLGDLELIPGDIEENLHRIEGAAEAILGDGKFFLALGGEHLVSYPLIRAVRRRYPDLAVIQLDAHADLREEYLGKRYSHATVMRLVAGEIGPDNLYQFGVRSCTWEELAYGSRETNFFLDKILEPLTRLVPHLTGRPLYLSVDIDVIDPAFAPGTGTPEPGGCRPQEIFEAIYSLKGSRVVAMDLVEVCPPHDCGDITSVLAAKIVREAVLCFG
ncbi:MAG TPA: agmatinase [Peptococcaceae bacterium]|nr:MAG: Agmatinase [Moorella sp. 60_41]HBT47237.1 agmatinase [Peptococcaceae bacterium]